MVQKALRNILEAIFEQALGPSAMMQNLYLLDVFVNVDADEVTLDIRDHDDGAQG